MKISKKFAAIAAVLVAVVLDGPPMRTGPRVRPGQYATAVHHPDHRQPDRFADRALPPVGAPGVARERPTTRTATAVISSLSTAVNLRC